MKIFYETKISDLNYEVKKWEKLTGRLKKNIRELNALNE